ncbi:unnamed protein product, partial [Medioppia subpectinata]
IQYEKNVLNLSENSFTDNEDIEKKECSTAGDNTSQSVYTNSESNSDTLWTPEPQSPSHSTPPKLPQKLHENLVKKFNNENNIVVINTGEDTISSSIAPVANTSPTEAETSCRSGFSFNNIITNAGFYVKQTLGLSTRTGTGVSDGVADDGVNRDGKLPEIQSTLPILKLSPVSTPILSPLAPGSHSSAPINYLDVVLNADTFITNASSPHMPYITFTACVNNTLANCPNRETAATVYPLFNTMNSFVPYFLMTAKDLAKLNELKRLFTEKCGECVDTTNDRKADT